MFAVPVLLVALALVIQATGGLESLAVRMLTPSFSMSVFLLIVATGLWRILSMGDAVQVAGGRKAWRERRTLATFGGLTAVTLLLHGTLGYTAWSAYDAGSRIFVGGPGATPAPGATPSFGGIDDEFAATPIATPTSETARVNILLTGIDSSEQRSHSLTDTLIVASVDPETGSVALVSFPRDLSRFELPDGRLYTGKINALMSYAARNPEQFPDGPFPTLLATLGHILGVPIHYYGAVNLDGFVRMVDLVGGVDVVNQKAINDSAYGGWTDGRPVGFRLSAGPHHLDGQEALAYARSRKGAGDNDFTRARRQQEVLMALRKRLLDPTVLPRVPELLQAAGDTLRSNFPVERLEQFLDIARAVDDANVRQVVLGPRTYATNPPASQTGGLYVLVPRMDAIRKLSIELFGEDSRYYVATAPSPSPATSPATSP